jgi:hypothetical protein
MDSVTPLQDGLVLTHVYDVSKQTISQVTELEIIAVCIMLLYCSGPYCKILLLIKKKRIRGLVRTRTIPTEWPPLVGEVSAIPKTIITQNQNVKNYGIYYSERCKSLLG